MCKYKKHNNAITVGRFILPVYFKLRRHGNKTIQIFIEYNRNNIYVKYCLSDFLRTEKIVSVIYSLWNVDFFPDKIYGKMC